MMPTEERVARLEAFRIAHNGEHSSLEKTLNRRFDDLDKKLDDRVFPLLHTHNPGNGKNGPKEVVVKVVFPSVGVGAGLASVLYWIVQVLGR